MKQLYIQGIFNEFAGRRDQAVADLNILLDNGVGVGEHGDISEEIKKKINTISDHDGVLSTMQRYFQPTNEAAPNAESPPAPPASPQSSTLPPRVLDENE